MEGRTIPGPRGWPVAGNFFHTDMKHFHLQMWKWFKEFGPVYKFRLFSRNIVVLSDTQFIERIFNREEFCHRPDLFSNYIFYNGSGVVASNYSDKDRDLQKVVWQAIHDVKDDAVIKQIHDREIDDFCNKLNTVEDFPISSSLDRSVTRQYATQIMGIQATDKHVDATLDYFDATNEFSRNGRQMVLTKLPWLRFIPGTTYRRVVKNLLAARDIVVSTYMAGTTASYLPGKEIGILHRILTLQATENSKHNHEYITKENVYSALLEMMRAGTVPTSHNIQFILMFAAKNPEIQTKIHAEIDRKCPHGIDHYTSIDRLPYLQAYITEAIRYLGLVYVYLAHEVAKDTQFEGYKFNKGDMVFGSIFNAHHDSNVWNDPWVVRPERFLDENGEFLPVSHPLRKHFIMYGNGLRYCKGKHLADEQIYKYIMNIFYRYFVKPPRNSELPSCDPRDLMTKFIIDIPAFECRFEKRINVEDDMCTRL